MSLMATDAMAQASICPAGTVFEDRDGDGARDAGEPGLHDVAVSNGRDIVRSDRQGRYRVDAAEGGFVFVIKPAGYSIGRRDDGMPDHWRAVQSNPRLKRTAMKSESESVLRSSQLGLSTAIPPTFHVELHDHSRTFTPSSRISSPRLNNGSEPSDFAREDCSRPPGASPAAPPTREGPHGRDRTRRECASC